MPGVLRAKGWFWVETDPNLIFEYSVAGGLTDLRPLGRWWAAISTEGLADRNARPWPGIHANWRAPFGDRRQELVFIGTGIDRVALTAALEACLVSRPRMPFVPGRNFHGKFAAAAGAHTGTNRDPVDRNQPKPTLGHPRSAVLYDRQHPADRLDPIRPAVIVDEGDHGLCRRSSSARAKYALALRRISLAWRSSRFSRSRALSLVAISLVRPGLCALSRSAFFTHSFSVCDVQPILASYRDNRGPPRRMLTLVIQH